MTIPSYQVDAALKAYDHAWRQADFKYAEAMRYALEAAQSATPPEEVVEITDAMREAGEKVFCCKMCGFDDLYRAMHSARPKDDAPTKNQRHEHAWGLRGVSAGGGESSREFYGCDAGACKATMTIVEPHT